MRSKKGIRTEDGPGGEETCPNGHDLLGIVVARTAAEPPQVPASTRVQVHVYHVPTMGCSVPGRGAAPLVRTQFLEHPPTLDFWANHLKKWIQHPQKPPIPFLSPHNPHCRGGFLGGVKELEHS